MASTPILIYTLIASNGTRLSKTKDQSYPLVKHFSSKEHKITTALQLNKIITKASAAGHCLIKGMLTRNLTNESRARSTDAALMTQWICFDLDGAPYKTPDDFVKDLPDIFHEVGYTTQYSASHGLKAGLRCHIFFLLKEPTYPIALKVWLKHLNFNIPTLKKSISLTSTNMGLAWPLDITVCQNDKIIYVAPPEDRKDKKVPVAWIQFTKKKQSQVDFAQIKYDANETKIQEKKVLNKLRIATGLTPRRSLNLKKIGSVEVMTNPGEVAITGQREERDFVYFNFNGGDSWAYYHHKDNPEIIYNFKSEPPYLTKELLPEYYASVKNIQATAPSGTTPADLASFRYMAFCDARTDAYYRGFYDELNHELDLYKTGSLTKLHHFLKQHGQPVPDFIPEWDLVYDFDSEELVNDDERWINLYQRTDYMKNTSPRKSPPVLIEKLIKHIVNYDDVVYNHLINWLAYIVQTRKQTGTAWVLHGTQGTGKGILFNQVMLPILGKSYVFRTTLDSFEQEFNAFLEHSLLVLVDEVQVSDLKRAPKAMSNLKQYITDSTVSIRRMRTDPYIVENHSNMMLASNKQDPVQIDTQDRRFNVAPRQEIPLLGHALTPAEVDQISSEACLQGFTDYLMSYKASRKKASEIIQTQDRRRLQLLTQDAAEELAEAVKSGNLKFLIENAPDSEDRETLHLKMQARGTRKYEEIVDALIQDSKIGQLSHLTRADLQVIFYYVVGTCYPSAHKFSKYLGHKGLFIRTIRIGKKTTRGMKNIKFNQDVVAIEQWNTRHEDERPTISAKQNTVVRIKRN